MDWKKVKAKLAANSRKAQLRRKLAAEAEASKILLEPIKEDNLTDKGKEASKE
jgi:hypothetical protein